MNYVINEIAIEPANINIYLLSQVYMDKQVQQTSELLHKKSTKESYSL